LRKFCPFRSRTPNRLEQNSTSLQHIIIKTTNIENRERIPKAVREKKQINIKYIGKSIKITADCSMEILKARKAWSEVFGHQMKITSTLGYSAQQNHHSKLAEQSSMINRN
jgi:hypothetical protein